VDGFEPPLSFDFKADVIPAPSLWRTVGVQRVYTGHAGGKITINIREADDAEREKRRLDLNESHRTLIGHFRHEIGHYYWEVLVRDRREAEFAPLFGDPHDPPYDQALEQYYANGPAPDWDQRFISAYASMHPWEDFAETFAACLEMIDVLDTARSQGWSLPAPDESDDFDALLVHHQRIGLAVNELNRSMGLIDLLPKVFTPPVVEKMRLIHRVLRESAVAAQEACES
jgi:hypothetical protein